MVECCELSPNFLRFFLLGLFLQVRRFVIHCKEHTPCNIYSSYVHLQTERRHLYWLRLLFAYLNSGLLVCESLCIRKVLATGQLGQWLPLFFSVLEKMLSWHPNFPRRTAFFFCSTCGINIKVFPVLSQCFHNAALTIQNTKFSENARFSFLLWCLFKTGHFPAPYILYFLTYQLACKYAFFQKDEWAMPGNLKKL